jgi:prevent-host-death family protein
MGKVKKISVSEFKAKSLGLFEEVARSGLEVIVTKRGEEIARVVPIAKLRKTRKAGQLQEMLVEEKDIVSPLGEDDWGVLR